MQSSQRDYFGKSQLVRRRKLINIVDRCVQIPFIEYGIAFYFFIQINLLVPLLMIKVFFPAVMLCSKIYNLHCQSISSKHINSKGRILPDK